LAERASDTEPVLALSKANFAAVMLACVDAVMTYDAEKRITAFNPGCEQLFGYSAGEAVGRPYHFLIPKRLRPTYVARWDEFAATSGEVYNRTAVDPVIMVAKDGREFPVLLSAAKITVGDSVVLATSMRDLSRPGAGAELALSQAKLAGIVTLSEDAIITVDEAQQITLFNPAAEQIFGYTADEILGQTIEQLIPAHLHGIHRRHVRGFVRSSEESRQMSLTGPITALRKNGEEFPAESAVAKFTLNGEQVLTVRLRDVSEKVKAEDLRVQLLAMEESSRLKMQLISTVSHELRSPLSAILGFTSLLIEYDDRLDDGERLQQLRVIEDSTRHLQRIVDDLLALSRLEAGVLEIQRETVALRPLLESVIAALGPEPTHKVKLMSRLPSIAVVGDQSRLRQVLSNLLDNSIKYSPPGGVIEIRTRKTREGVMITVRDYGPGVPLSETEAIFDAFYRSANASADDARSTGLGLAICKGLVEAHGGEIRATLPDDGGLAVSFTLPLAG
jgi:PAS domain S-box-containing protein